MNMVTTVAVAHPSLDMNIIITHAVHHCLPITNLPRHVWLIWESVGQKHKLIAHVGIKQATAMHALITIVTTVAHTQL